MGEHAGGCHCGNVRYVLTSALAALPLRACQCSFCRRHGAVSTSDPAGALRFVVKDESRVMRYRFGLRSADFLICGGCGVYVGAVLREDAGTWAVINANTLDTPLAGAPVPMDYDGEDTAARSARRRQRWTPVVAL